MLKSRSASFLLSRVIVFWVVGVFACGTLHAAHIPADHSAFNYAGRIDFSQPKSPVFIWQGSTVSTRFYGKTLSLEFAELSGQAFFDLEINGNVTRIQAQNGRVSIAQTLTDNWHSLRLFKRTEASVGHVQFKGIHISEADKLEKPSLTAHKHHFIFYGDSITAGACNEDGAEDQWGDFSTHNNAKSYAAMTAKHLNANYRNIAISGVGISIGYQPYTIDQVWNRLYPDPTSALANLNAYKPTVVFMNFGENDDSFTTNNKLDFPADYQQRYINLVRSVRSAYPKSKIVILRGGMYGGAKSERLITPWKSVVKQLEAEDKNLTHFVFEHWHNLHPRVENHQKMADELSAWLKQQAWF